MEGEISKVDNLERLQEKTPFLIHIPKGMELRNVTYRNEGKKWATLRYECTIEGETLRIKEFFLDWFYPGFPKSLMNSFVSSYSRVESQVLTDRVIFYGRDYKGKEASSSFSLGTQIEIEGETRNNVKKISEIMVAPYISERFRYFPFYRRSFFANSGNPEWFEEERISNMDWHPPKDKFCAGSLCVDSVGDFRRKGIRLETIWVLSEEYYRRAVWVDMARNDFPNEHLFYEFRRDGNFFDEYLDFDYSLAFRRDYGPSIARSIDGNNVLTVSLSPLFNISDANNVIRTLIASKSELENLI